MICDTYRTGIQQQQRGRTRHASRESTDRFTRVNRRHKIDRSCTLETYHTSAIAPPLARTHNAWDERAPQRLTVRAVAPTPRPAECIPASAPAHGANDNSAGPRTSSFFGDIVRYCCDIAKSKQLPEQGNSSNVVGDTVVVEVAISYVQQYHVHGLRTYQVMRRYKGGRWVTFLPL